MSTVFDEKNFSIIFSIILIIKLSIILILCISIILVNNRAAILFYV